MPPLALWEAWRAHQNGPATQATARQWLQGHGSQAQIRAALSSVLVNVWSQSFATGATMAMEALGFLVHVHDDKVKHLESEWVDEITGTYMNLLAVALATGESPDDVKDVLADGDHAGLIALTEVNRGENTGAFEVYQAAQTPLVIWVTTSADPCQECLDNQAAGPWPLGKPFPSGVVMPPDHPHCQCHLEPA